MPLTVRQRAPLEHTTADNYIFVPGNGVGNLAPAEGKAAPHHTPTAGRTCSLTRHDASISAMTITPEREQQIDFSDPYFNADQSL